MADENLNYQQVRYAEYSKQRSELFKTLIELGGRYDQWILTLSAGAIALSVAFLEKIAPHPQTNTIFLLGFSWLSLLVALLAGFISLLTAQYGASRQIQILDEEHKAFMASNEKPDQNPEQRPRENKFNTYTNLLNWISACAFVLGVLLLCLFAYANVSSTAPPSTLPPTFDVNVHIQNAPQLPVSKSGTNAVP